MKRSAPWEASLNVSSDDSSDSDSGDTFPNGKKSGTTIGGPETAKDITAEAPNSIKKRGTIKFEALSRHGYHGGPSILKMPPPKVEEKEKDWTWSIGKEHREANTSNIKESSEESKHPTGAVLTQHEKLSNVDTKLQANGKEKALNFSQKEKRKRDLGQASRGKSYVEEEKRLLRESGVYSGFDT